MKRRPPRETYTHWHVLLATSEAPITNDLRVCSDAFNLHETLVAQGTVQDSRSLLADAIEALAMAGKRHLAGGQIRRDGRGIQAVCAVLEDYAAVLAALPERVMVQRHRPTERRLRAILAGKRQPHDVEVVAI